MFYISGIFLSLFLALVLITKRAKTNADSILACWLFIIGVHLTQYYLSLTIDPYYYPYLMVGYPLPLIHGPMLYFYTASLTNQHQYLSRHWIWHFIPLILIYLLLIPFFNLPYEEKLLTFESQGSDYKVLQLFHRILVHVSGIVYVALSLSLLFRHKKLLRDRFSQVEKINLMWLRYLIYGEALVWLAVFFNNDLIIFSLVTVFVMLLGYFGIKQVGIFTQLSESSALLSEETRVAQNNDNSSPSLDQITLTSNEIVNESEGPKVKYHKSVLTPETINAIHRQLCVAIDTDRLFLNPELTIAELANALGVHANYLSQVINQIEGKSFYDFINGKRIEEFKRLAALPENQKYTLLALAFDCGFNSKTAFYRNFKSVTGVSPNQYLKEQELNIRIK